MFSNFSLDWCDAGDSSFGKNLLVKASCSLDAFLTEKEAAKVMMAVDACVVLHLRS